MQKTASAIILTSKACENDAAGGLYYYRVGRGNDVLVFLHGVVGAGMLDFAPQLQSQLMLDQFDMIAIDLRGCGKSRPPEKDFSGDFYRTDAVDVASLMDSLKIRQYSVAGWSYGATVGLILAAMRRDAVQALMVWGPIAYLERKIMDKVVKREHHSTWNPRILNRLATFYAVDVAQSLWSGWIRGATRLVDERDGDICRDDVTMIECPTLVMHGCRDPLNAVHHVEFVKANVRGPVAYHEFDEGRHEMHLDCADEFNRKVVEFFKKNVR